MTEVCFFTEPGPTRNRQRHHRGTTDIKSAHMCCRVRLGAAAVARSTAAAAAATPGAGCRSEGRPCEDLMKKSQTKFCARGERALPSRHARRPERWCRPRC